MNQKRIGILTSGGDCSGLNSIIRSAFIRANDLGYEFIGFKRGIYGIISRPLDYVVLDSKTCDEFMLTRSGSILYSNTRMLKQQNGEKTPIEVFSNLLIEGYKSLDLDGLIYVGGDGSMSMMNRLLNDHNNEINLIAIPKTIDNDVSHTDFSVGFHTSVEVVSNAIDDIRSTAMSHERVMIVEVMGRDAGYIAMYAGVASGADIILVPEFKYDMDRIISKVKECYESSKNHCIIVVSEAVEAPDFKHENIVIDAEVQFSKKHYMGIGEHLCSILKEKGFDTRSTKLGHIQRGGKTSIMDRVIGSAFGFEAVNLIDQGKTGFMMSYKHGKIESTPLQEVSLNVNQKLSCCDICVQIAKNTGIYIGDI